MNKARRGHVPCFVSPYAESTSWQQLISDNAVSALLSGNFGRVVTAVLIMQVTEIP